MNRAQRRAAAKGVPSYKRGRTAAELLNAMAKNGITAADYKKAYEKTGVELDFDQPIDRVAEKE